MHRVCKTSIKIGLGFNGISQSFSDGNVWNIKEILLSLKAFDSGLWTFILALWFFSTGLDTVFNYTSDQETTVRTWNKRSMPKAQETPYSLNGLGDGATNRATDLHGETQTPGSLPLNQQTSTMNVAVDMAILPWLLNVKNNMDRID